MAESRNKNKGDLLYIMHDLGLIKIRSENFLKNEGVLIFNNQEEKHHYKNHLHISQNDKRALFKEWTEVINWSINLGNNHFAITISNTGIYLGNRFVNDPISNIIWKIFAAIDKDVWRNFPTTTWTFIVPELTKNNEIHFHAIFAIKNIIDYNFCLQNSLNILLPLTMHYNFKKYLDVKISPLKYFNDIRNWVMYMHRDIKKWPYQGSISVTYYYQNIFFNELFFIYQNIILTPLFNEDGTEHDGVDEKFEYFAVEISTVDINKVNQNIKNLKERFQDYLTKINIINTFEGVKLINNKLNNLILIKLLKYYIVFNNYYIYNNNIYKKIENTTVSYSLVDSLRSHLYDNFLNNVKSYYLNNFNTYFNGFDFDTICDNYLIKTKTTIDSLDVLLTNRINLDFSILEFNDGLYFIKYNKFLPLENVNILMKKNISTLKYFNKKYKQIQNKKPDIWINSIKNTLGIKNDICKKKNTIFIGILFLFFKIFQGIFDKKNIIYIFGEPGTAKSILISDILYKIFEKQQIRTTTNHNDLQSHYKLSRITSLLKNYGDTRDLVEFFKIPNGGNFFIYKKYQNKFIIINQSLTLILTDYEYIRDFSLADGFDKNSTSYFFEFKNEVENNNLVDFEKFKKKILDEEVNIILYCNKYFFKKNNGFYTKKPSEKDFLSFLKESK